jgi:Na+/proline symporter
VGAASRLFLVVWILQTYVFDQWRIPFLLTVTVSVLFVWLYTFRSGVKTILWTDILQTFCLIGMLILILWQVKNSLGMDVSGMVQTISENPHFRIFEWKDWGSTQHFVKQFFSGVFITIVMTGLDQDMMQKNLTCKSLKDAQRNMMSFTSVLVIVNAFFLLLGGLLLVYAQQKGINLSGLIPEQTDRIYPTIALEHLGIVAAAFFVIGLIAAGYSSADGTFAALTTTFCFDILNMDRWTKTEKQRLIIRRLSHVLMSLLFLGVILVFSNFHNDALIRIIFKVAGYTYGPILGLFAFGMFTKREIRNGYLIPILAVIMPVTMFFISKFSVTLLGGYKFGFELLILNGGLMFLGLLAVSEKNHNAVI